MTLNWDRYCGFLGRRLHPHVPLEAKLCGQNAVAVPERGQGSQIGNAPPMTNRSWSPLTSPPDDLNTA